jgi:hypothetical protein
MPDSVTQTFSLDIATAASANSSQGLSDVEAPELERQRFEMTEQQRLSGNGE